MLIGLLVELDNIADAIIGIPGAGLSIEQRKRLNIGIELVAKPLLLFLDEPTSGLDGQSSFLIVQFLRKLAAAGQSVVCVIHQPSACVSVLENVACCSFRRSALFDEFDQLLLLQAGGRTSYFGPIAKVTEYFGSKGAKKPDGVNPAECALLPTLCPPSADPVTRSHDRRCLGQSRRTRLDAGLA
jgi:ATP-binding cassette subfamily G (WHITE) protein 2 (SNQ2)